MPQIRWDMVSAALCKTQNRLYQVMESINLPLRSKQHKVGQAKARDDLLILMRLWPGLTTTANPPQCPTCHRLWRINNRPKQFLEYCSLLLLLLCYGQVSVLARYHSCVTVCRDSGLRDTTNLNSNYRHFAGDDNKLNHNISIIFLQRNLSCCQNDRSEVEEQQDVVVGERFNIFQQLWVTCLHRWILSQASQACARREVCLGTIARQRANVENVLPARA